MAQHTDSVIVWSILWEPYPFPELTDTIKGQQQEGKFLYLDREVVGSVRQVVPATQGWLLRPHVHFEMLEKVNILQVHMQ